MRGWWSRWQEIRRHAQRVFDGEQPVDRVGCGLRSEPQAGGER